MCESVRKCAKGDVPASEEKKNKFLKKSKNQNRKITKTKKKIL